MNASNRTPAHPHTSAPAPLHTRTPTVPPQSCPWCLATAVVWDCAAVFARQVVQLRRSLSTRRSDAEAPRRARRPRSGWRTPGKSGSRVGLSRRRARPWVRAAQGAPSAPEVETVRPCPFYRCQERVRERVSLCLRACVCSRMRARMRSRVRLLGASRSVRLT